MTTSETFEGTVAAVNERGIRLGDDWYNLSKFKPLELPARGDQVRIAVDPKGFLCSIEVLEHTAVTASLSRAQTITRLAVLKAAASFLGALSQTREEVRSDHVLTLADKWLAWVEEAP
jgi:hypothetical protein